MSHSKMPADMTELPAGRYEFKDNGIYIGEWFNDKAVGLGLITKDKSQGEFTGLWNNGCEKSGTFLWPNAPGAMYEGEWAHTKRHGYGIFTREDWVIIGRFKEDFIYTGVKCKERSIGKYEGEFENGLPIFGVETYADGGSYAGEYKNGIRNGLGIRTSIPYGEVLSYFPDADKNRHRRDSLTSQRSGAHDRETPSPSPGAIGETHSKSGATLLRMSTKFKCGFVLSGQRSDLLIRRLKRQADRRRTAETKKGKKWRSVGSVMPGGKGGRSEGRRGDGSFRSAHSVGTYGTLDSGMTLDGPQEDYIDPECLETYSGEWVQDLRQGYGICERSDGVKYEGQWLNNLRHGFGVTHFPDGTLEAGRYLNGQLVFLAGKRNLFYFFYSYHIGKMVEGAVKKARDISDNAKLKAKEAEKRVIEVRQDVDKAKKAAQVAREYSLETRELVQELYPDFEQPGIKYLRDIVRMMKVTKRGHNSFEATLNEVVAVLEGSLIPDGQSEATDSPQAARGGNLLTVDGAGGVSRRSSKRGSFRRSFRGRSAGAKPVDNVETIVVKKQSGTLMAAPPTRVQGSQGQIKISTAQNRQRFPTITVGTPQVHKVGQLGMVPPSVTVFLEEEIGAPKRHQYKIISKPPPPPPPKEEITTILLPVPILHSSSAIPTVPLQNLLNSTLLSDHFDHYDRGGSGPPNSMGIYAAYMSNMSNINSKTLPNTPGNKLSNLSGSNRYATIDGQIQNSTYSQISGGQNHYQQSIPASNSNTLSSSHSHGNRDHPRRRTMPIIMTSPPVKPVTLIPTVGQDEILSAADNDSSVSGKTDRQTNDKNACNFIIENGVRKRVRAQEDIDGSSSGTTTITSTYSSLNFRPLQDELGQLPRNYRFESEIELRKDLGEGSLPDVSVCRRLQNEVLMTRDEVSRLGDARRLEQERELQRRLQGEIVIQFNDFKSKPTPACAAQKNEPSSTNSTRILAAVSRENNSTLTLISEIVEAAIHYHFTRLKSLKLIRVCLQIKDWCINHILLIIVLLFNAGLGVLFYMLLTAPPPHSKPS